MKKVLYASVIVFLVFAGYASSEKQVMIVSTELQQVSLFKNGLGFFISEVTIPDKVKTFSIIPEAAVSHGTFWVSYPPRVAVESVIAKQVDGIEQVEPTTMADLLKANIGKKVKIYLSDKAESSIDGKILNVTEEEKKSPPNPYEPGTISGAENTHYYGIRNIVLLDSSQGQIAVGAERIVRVDLMDKKPALKCEKKSSAVRLDISLKKAAGGQKLLISYLAKGVNWAPSYMLDITEPNNAKIAAKAEIMNEVCDFNGVDVRLVTGFPNLQFADIAGPITMKENLAQFLQSLIRGQSERGHAAGGVMSNVMAQSIAYGRMEMSGALMPAYGAAELGKTAEDLFLYPIEKVRLAKNDVGYFPLFTESAPYRHIYRWEIPDYVNPEGGYYDDRSRQRREPEQEVWHCIRLDNVMKMPWTTAPAEIIKDGTILGQDTLNYTPVKGQATVKITRAVNVKAEQVELEKDRRRDAGQWYGYHYDLVTVEGKLSVTNYQEKPIALEITKFLSGEVKAMVPEAKLEKLAKSLRAVNPNIKLTWNSELGPGDKKDFTYNYEVYVRR